MLRMALAETQGAPGIFTQRQDALQRLLSVPTVETRGIRSVSPDTVVLLPIHHDEHRYETAALTLKSLTQQTLGQIHVLMADNGMSPEGRAHLERVAEGYGLPLTVVSAHPKEDAHRSPAYARNTALTALRDLRREDPTLRGPVLEIDSDNVALPNAVDYMRQTLYGMPDAVAVSGDIIPTQHISEEQLDEYAPPPNEEVTRVLPNLWRNGNVDVLSIVAFSSQVAGKTTGFLLDPALVGTILDYANEVYITMPNKSAEDMIASAALRRHGVIYHDPRARFLDEARESDQQTRRQQIRWGRDHTLLVHDLQRLGLVPNGIQVLEPHGDRWAIWELPHTEELSGFIINPTDVQATAKTVSHALSNGISHEFSQQELRTLHAGLDVMGHVMTYVDTQRRHASISFRNDLPSPVTPDENSPRFSKTARNARLIGNLLGLSDVTDVEKASRTATLPPAFLFGGRQAASWA